MLSTLPKQKVDPLRRAVLPEESNMHGKFGMEENTGWTARKARGVGLTHNAIWIIQRLAPPTRSILYCRRLLLMAVAATNTIATTA